MNTEQLIRLADRADDVTGRADDRLTEVHDRIRTHRRRRTAGAVVSAGALVLAVLTGATLLSDSSDPAPDPAPPGPHRVDPVPAGSVRPLTWTDEFWPSRHVQYGDRVIDTGLDRTEHDFAQMDLTDDGIVLTTVDGRVWFADGSTVDRIADTGVSHDFLALLDVRTGNAGSLAAWVDEHGLTVYDTAAGQVVFRRRCATSGCEVAWVGDERVFWRVSAGHRPGLWRLDVPSGLARRVSGQALASEMLDQPRTLVVGDSFRDGTVTDGLDVTFVRQGTTLRASGLGTTVPESLTRAFDGNRHPLRLRVPDGYDRAASFTSFQWLDDDRLALMAGAGTMGVVFGPPGTPESTRGYGDVLVCRISTGECRLAAPGPGEPVDRDGDGQADDLRIVPGYGTPGTN